MKKVFDMQILRSVCSRFVPIIKELAFFLVLALPLAFVYQNKPQFIVMLIVDIVFVTFRSNVFEQKDKEILSQPVENSTEPVQESEEKAIEMSLVNNTPSEISASDDFEAEIIGFEFEDVNKMALALKTGNFEYDAYYELDGKGYIFVYDDENTTAEMTSYGAREMTTQEEEEVLDRTLVQNSGVFVFYTEEDMVNFFHLAKMDSKFLNYEYCYYTDLSYLDEKTLGGLRHIAMECLAEELDDMYEITNVKQLIANTPIEEE